MTDLVMDETNNGKGWYDPDTDTIHIAKNLEGKELLRVKKHEEVHAERRHKITFKIANLFRRYVMALMIAVISSAFIGQTAYTIVWIVTLLLFSSFIYEEAVAVYKTWLYERENNI